MGHRGSVHRGRLRQGLGGPSEVVLVICREKEHEVSLRGSLLEEVN